MKKILPILLILLAMPSLCYAHSDFVMIVLFGVPLAWLVLPIFLYVILSAKSEKSNYSPRTKFAIRTILALLLVIWLVITPFLMFFLTKPQPE